MRITGLYAALATLLVILLIVRVALRRRETRVGIGDGGDHELLKRIRAHANAMEVLPLGLILLLLVELNQTQPIIVHIFGISLIVGRALHAWGLSHSSAKSFGRMVGMLLNLFTLLAMALLLLWQFTLALALH